MPTNLLYQLERVTQRLIPAWLLTVRYQNLLRIPLPISPPAGFLPDSLTITSGESQAGAQPVDDRWRAFLMESLSQRRIELGGQPWGVWDSRNCVGQVWFSLGNYFDLETRHTFEIPAGSAWLFGAWIHRKWRRHGIYRHLLHVAGQSLIAKGVHTLQLAVDASNRRSIEVHRRLGGIQCGYFYGGRALTLGGFVQTQGGDSPDPADRDRFRSIHSEQQEDL